jgi:hypothetical protein
MRDRVKVVYSDEGCAFSIWRNVMIAYFREPATVERMRGFRQTQRELARQPDPVGCVIVSGLHSSAKMDLTEDTRRAIIDAIKAYEDRDLCVSVVIEVRGFLGTTVRALIAGLILLSRPKYPMKIFGEHEDGARWLFEKMYRGGPGGDTRALIAAIEETGAKVPAPA